MSEQVDDRGVSVSHFVPVDEIMQITGLGPIQVRRDIRGGYLPGSIRHSKVFVLRSEWNAYLANEWRPAPTRQPVSLHPVGKQERAS